MSCPDPDRLDRESADSGRPTAPSSIASSGRTETKTGFVHGLGWKLTRPYIRFVYLVLTANIAFLVYTVRSSVRRTSSSDSITPALLSVSAVAATVNVSIAIVIRNEYFINALFAVTTSVPLSTSLSVRKLLAKVYSYGGVHSGCAVAGTLWHTFTASLLVWSVRSGQHAHRRRSIVAAMSASVLATTLLVAICVTSLPAIRSRFHNLFERVHRFAGWSVLVLFWVQTMVIARIETTDKKMAIAIVSSPAFWLILVSTAALVQPWIKTRRHDIVQVDRLDNHAVRLYFAGRVPSCMAVKLADCPVMETHSFATIPDDNQTNRFSVIVSSAGDWTCSIVQTPPTRLWIRGGPISGVLRTALMFSPLVIVATGSGIGPCLGLFNDYPRLQCRIVWSARRPSQTYGSRIVDAVLRADSHARIIDSRTSGRLDILSETLTLYEQANAEAVFCISNAPLTRRIVRQLERRNIPAFGPIWDS